MTETKSIQLLRAAKDLNVGRNTIIEYLAEKGHVIEDKPSARLSMEQYNLLLSAFKQDLAVKKEAEEINIGKVRKDKAEEEKEEVIERPKVTLEGPTIIGKVNLDAKKEPAKKPEPIAEEKPATQIQSVQETPVPEVEEKTVSTQEDISVESPEPTIETEVPKVKIKVVDKINLDSNKKKTKEVPAKKSEPETPTTEEKIVSEKSEEPVILKEEEQPKPEEPAIKEDEIIRAEAEKLAGVKVMYKIDLPDKKTPVKTDNQKKKRKRIGRVVNTGKEQTATEGKATEGAGTNTERHTSDRRGGFNGDRNNNRNQNNNKRGRRKDEPQNTTISGKEINDKIKATMAKMVGGNTNKGKSAKAKNRRHRRELAGEAEEEGVSKIQVTEFISVSELANIMDVSPTQVISACFSLGIIVSINQRIDAEVIELVANEFGYEVEFINIANDEAEEEEEDAPEDLQPRSPIVTIMGHVDHGKTSLLDYIRNANIVAGEAGGITQHIGAYEVTLPKTKKKVTFLDTPGHEAFTAMRARGAKLTDIVVIVVAADDNVMPQTKEAISHALAAEVPMIIAINKIDKPTANPDNIKKQLADMNILIEEWGGKYQCQEISAKKGTGVDELLEKILLEAEMLDLKANPDRLALGSVVEASLDKGRGYVSTVMVQNGTLHIGDFVVAGQYFGKVKALTNERGARVKKAGPSQPVQVLGLNGAPTAGDNFKVYESEQEAKEIANKRATILREQGIRAQKHITLDEIGRRLALGNFKELKLIVKGDVAGSVEALNDSLLKLSTEEIQVSIILSGVGAITENDVLLAAASDAVIVAFQVRPTANSRALAEKESIEIRNYSIIYDAIEDVKKAMEGMLEPKFEEKIVAEVEVREIFKISKVGTIAGCYVQDGKILKSNKVRVIRDGIVIHTGSLDALKRFKDDVKEVTKGFECGIKLKDFNDIREGDIIESFEEVEVQRKL